MKSPEIELKLPYAQITITLLEMKFFFWIDLEMSGLDDANDKILEVAALVTDVKLNAQETFHRVVFQPNIVLETMNDWCKKTHGDSGLTAAIPSGSPIEVVEKDMIEFCKRYFQPNERIILVGNSVHNDRRFIDRYMPELAKLLHYRIIDISSFKEIFKSKYKVEYKKKNAHRAIDDIHESIAELKHYLSFVNLESRESED